MEKAYLYGDGVFENSGELIDCVDNCESIFGSFILCNKKNRNNLFAFYEVQGF